MDKKKKYKVVIVVIAVLVCGIIYITTNYRQMPSEVVTEQFADDEKPAGGKTEPQEQGTPAEADKGGSMVYIHICGEIKKPGVYTFSTSPRLVEVVECAGGFTKKADRSAVNQAELVEDGSQITIPSKQDKKQEEKALGTKAGDKININTATREELMTLNGIGESKASQIISYREENGLFKRIDDIMNISGIKEGVFNKIKDRIIVS